MGLLDQINDVLGGKEPRANLKVSELRPIESGNTIPNISPRAKVVHLRNFETIADDLENVRDKIGQTQRERIELEETIERARDTIQNELKELRHKEATLCDELTQHIEAILPDAELVHKTPQPPRPEELDVKVQDLPPAIPENE